MKPTRTSLGQSLIELIITISLLAILLPVLGYGFIVARDGKVQQQQRLKATALMKEAIEAVRSVRSQGWNDFAVNGDYHAVISGNSWSLVAEPAEINGFNQLINISDAYRNEITEELVNSPGKADPSTKKITVTISWNIPQPSSVSSILYMTRLENDSLVYTTRQDYEPGILTNTSVADTPDTAIENDGEVVLAAGGGGGNWCIPSKSIVEADLPKQGVANAITAIEGSVFTGTGENASGVSFAKVSLTTEEDPPQATLNSTFDGFKTNAVFGEEEYAYLTTDSNGSQVVIIDLNQYSDPPTNMKYKQVGAINLGTGSVQGQSIYVKNNTAYITASNGRFFIYDITNHASPIAKNGAGLLLDGIGRKVLVAGDYAYISIGSTSNQLNIVNVSDPANPTIVGRLNLGTGQSGIDVYVDTSNSNPGRAYLATNWVTGISNFYIVNVSNKSAPSVSGLSGYNTSGMEPTGLTVVDGNRAIIVGSGGTNQYQVVDISNESDSLSLCGGLQYATGIKGVSSVLQSNGYAYSYIITSDANAELKIILGGAGGLFITGGTFTSEPYTNDTETSFNRFTASVNTPVDTELKLQVSVANKVNDSCDHDQYTYIGPDKDNPFDSFFIPVDGLVTGAVPYRQIDPYYINPGQCFRYKTHFSSSDNTKSPSLYDITINYSP